MTPISFLYSRRICYHHNPTFSLFQLFPHLNTKKKKTIRISTFFSTSPFFNSTAANMPELWLSRKTQFSSLLISDLKQFCCFVVSHPLYFSYFVFFSPYLLKILSFLFPLVFTTSLLLLAFLTVSPGLIAHRKFSPDSKTSKIEDGNQECFDLEDFEAYKIVFEGPIMDVRENQAEFSEQSSAENSPAMEEDFGEFKSMANVNDEKKVEAQGANDNKVVENQKARNGSEETNVNKTANDSQRLGVNRPALKLESSTTLDYNLVSNGSMRKEKEWKRTLACKLYEERNSTDGSGEGMDLLWETYEMDAIKSKTKHNESKKKSKKRGETKRYNKDSDDEDEEGEVSDQLCCLQALKFSAGKVNLGMGKPNLMKISKAIKGFGWLHHVSKHSKKVHIEDRF